MTIWSKLDPPLDPKLFVRPARHICVDGPPNVVEVGDPGVSGNLTPVVADDGKVIYTRENMNVAEALAYGQAALDRHDARIATVTVGGKRFPTYETNPAIEKQRVETFTQLRAEVELALKGNKTADVQIVPSLSSQSGTRLEVTKPIREKYPVQYNLRLLWVRLRDWTLLSMERLTKFLRRI